MSGKSGHHTFGANQIVMKSLIILKKLRFLIAIGLILFVHSTKAQMSYEEFHAKYIPHYEKPAASFEVVELIQKEDANTGALAIQYLIQLDEQGDSEANQKILFILSSVDRKKVAQILAILPAKDALDALTRLKAEWQRELMWFVDKTTYHNLAAHMNAIILWDGPQGPFGPLVDDWGITYAGAGFDKGWSPFKGLNEFMEPYGGEYLRGTTGFSVMAAFKTPGDNLIEPFYQNRWAKSKYDIGNSQVKFSAHTIGASYLMSKNPNGQFLRFWHGVGAHVNIAKWATDHDASSFTKVDGGINFGLHYSPRFTLNPKNLPVLFSLNPYIQLNFPKFDYNTLHDDINLNAYGTSTNDNYKSGFFNLGIQFSVAYKFGKEDTREFIAFDDELDKNHDPHVNTSYSEILPIISPDGKTLYFVRSDHPYNNFGSYSSQDVWVADLSGGLESAEASRLKGPVNLDQNNAIAGVSPDGNSMLIKGVYDSNNKLKGQGYSIIFKTKDGWTDPKALDIDSYADMAQGIYVGAYWTQDGKHLILSLSEDEKVSAQDLYVSHLQEDGTWSKPQSLGPTLNTKEGSEHSPYMASDGKTMYFSSDREGSIGSNDIWMTKREDDSWTKWSEPVNLGEDVNTEEWDAYYTIDAQGQYAYLSSHENSKGRSDIVRIKLAEDVQPDPVVLIRGKVLNQKTGEPLDATISYNGIVDHKNYGVARTDPATGAYTIVLPYGINYDFSAEAEGFIGISDNLDLTGVGEYQEIERDLYLVPIEVGATVRLNNIFFETGKAELKAESYAELNRVIKFLNDNPEIKIEISGHTDNVGSKDKNKTLSEERAKAVMDYLISKGIDASRLVAKGYGMEKPVADNATDEGKALNRRVEFTILEN